MPILQTARHEALRPRLEKSLAAFLDEQYRKLLAIDGTLLPVAETLRDFVLCGGKRLRPAFGYWGYRGAGGVDTDEVVHGLASLELLHACALIHDDVMDCSDTRRGEPAVHRRFADMHVRRGWGGDPEGFGRSAAILLGDLALGWSAEMFAGCGAPADRLVTAGPVYDEMRTEVMAGQYLDMLTQTDQGAPSRARASQVARYKSAKYTVERPLHLGGRLAGANDRLLAAYSAFGLPLGEAFQLRDDVLGVFGDPSETGKPAGDDLREGKQTVLVALAAQRATEVQGKALRDGLGDPSLDEAGVGELRSIITGTGALAEVEERISELTRTALATLDPAPITAESRAVLAELAIAATARKG